MDVPSPAAPEEIARRILSGDRAAEDDLVARYARGIRTILRAACRDASASEDLAQETFRIAIEKIRRGELHDPARLSGFICAIARNLALRHFQKAEARRPAGTPDPEMPTDPTSGPLETLLRTERAEIVRRVLAQMPSRRDHQLLFRFYIVGDDKPDICRDLGLSSLNFNRVLYRAKARYRALFRATQASPARAG